VYIARLNCPRRSSGEASIARSKNSRSRVQDPFASGSSRQERAKRAARAPRRRPRATLRSFRGSGHLEISDDVDMGSRTDRVARGGSPFTKSNIRVVYHLAVANAEKVCVRLSARHKTLSRSASGGVAGGSVASVTTGADILIINSSPATAVNRLVNLIGAWLRLHLRGFAASLSLSLSLSPSSPLVASFAFSHLASPAASILARPRGYYTSARCYSLYGRGTAAAAHC